MRTFISTGRNKNLAKIDNSSILAGGYRWSKYAAYIELPNIIGGDHSHCYCLYALPKNQSESYLVCYLPELGRFEQVCRDETEIEPLLASCPTLKQIAQTTETKNYNTCFLLRVKDFSHKGLSTKHLCIATILKTAFDEIELFNSNNHELYDKISLIISTANKYLAEENNVTNCLEERNGSIFRQRKLKRFVRVALIGIIGFDLLDLLDNDIVLDMDDDWGSENDFLEDGDFEALNDVDTDSPTFDDEFQSDFDGENSVLETDISDRNEARTAEQATGYHRYRDISFTGYLNCLECGCGSYIPGEGNYCRNCHHSFFSHRRPGD